ncbi:MAG TPA: DNA repair exonuclease, partial [Planctomycetota bacterium]|nr:DNA repair exonuclease [Planctomycetota bacterium]
FRFVHCSDLHLDGPCVCEDDGVRKRLAEESRASLGRLVELCLSEQVQALLVAGDLFDDERMSFGTEELLLASFGRLTRAGVSVVLACGNHDSAAPGGRMGSLAWPSGVTVVGPEPAVVEVHDRDGRLAGRVVAVGHGGPHDSARLIGRMPAAAEDVPSVALLHGRCDGVRHANHHEALAPFNTDDITASGHRYWALGHVHERQLVCRKPVAWYSGSLVPHGFAEPGLHGALLVSIVGRAEPRIDFRPLGVVRFEAPDVTGLALATDLSGVRTACVTAFETLRAEDGRPDALWMLRFELSGPCPAAADCQREDLLDEVAEELTSALRPFGVLHVEVSDAGITHPVDLAPHAGRPSVLGEALTLAQSLDDDAVLDRLVPATLAGAGSAADKRAYVRALLKDIERATAEALLKEVRP